MPFPLDLPRFDPFLAAALSLAVGWTSVAVVLWRGLRQLPHWDRVVPEADAVLTDAVVADAVVADAESPGVTATRHDTGAVTLPTASLIVAARDEATSLGRAVRSLPGAIHDYT